MSIWSKRCLSILIYHRVLPKPDPVFPHEVDAARFDSQLRVLKRCFKVLPLSEAVRRLRNDTLPPRAACITFDDGYADNAEVALPLLQRYELPASFFLATSFLNGGQMWNDTIIDYIRKLSRPRLDWSAYGLGRHAIGTPAQKAVAIDQILRRLKYLPFEQRQNLTQRIANTGSTSPMMRTEQVRALYAAGMEIGAHTMHHPILSTMSDAECRKEIAGSKRALETMLDAPIRGFAYPNGKPGQDYKASHVAMVKDAGFDYALSTADGLARRQHDRYQLPRSTPWETSGLGFMLRMHFNILKSAHQAARRPA